VTLQPGNTLGNYQIVEKIGAGGMGAVYKAYQPGLGRYVAIKVLPPQTAGDPAFAERFAQEARAIGKLRHPNIVTAFDFTQQGDFAYLVSDYIDGGTLADQLGTPLPLDYALGIVGPIAGALDYAHSRGIVHRDIKPQNVLLTREGTPVLTDFGLAKIVGPGSGMTQVGSLMGTADYMAPELAGGAEAAGPAADQYALGIIAYQMLVGRHPFPADNPLSALMAHVHKPVPIPSQLGVVLPPGAEAALLRALSKKPEDRFARAADFVRALAGSQYAVPAPAATLAALAAPTPAEAMAVSPLVSASGLVGPVARVEPPAGPAILAPAAVAGSAAAAVMVAPKKRGGFPWRRALVPGILVLVLAVLSLRGGSDLNAGIDRLDPAQPTAPRATLPVVAPTATPTVAPTATPSAAPTPTPTTASTTSPTPAPTARPSVTPTVAPSAVDAGHTPATATTIAPGTYRGTIAPAGEVDFFRVNVPTNTFIAVDLRAESLPNGGVAIFNASGTEVAAEVTTGADHLARVTHMAREAGYYIIRVRGTRADLTGTYTLTYASTAR
jgi:serine/threonine-protein kinase